MTANLATTQERPKWKNYSLDGILFSLAIGIYLITRLVALEDFPIYFFADEAVHSNLAENLVSNGFRYQDQLLPAYFPIGASYGLNSITVYLNIIPVLLFGKSIFVARATAVLISILGAVAVSLILRNIFKLPYWWVATLIISITPTWFLHSRTAFENVMVASFYACFLYFYLSYRKISAKYLFAAIIFGAFTFYSHGLGQFLIAITSILFLFSDLQYHWTNRKIILLGLILIMILLIPYIRFLSSGSTILTDQMRMRGSYWINSDYTAGEKIIQFGREYLFAFNPNYWFNPQPEHDLVRHLMKGYGHLFLPGLVFLIWGGVVGVKNIREPAYRNVLLALIASPFGAALTQITILRTIWSIIPITVLTGVGLIRFLKILETHRISRKLLASVTYATLALMNFYMLWDALNNGPLWFKDYTLYGMQYGAGQVFGELIPEILEEGGYEKIDVTPTWANGTDQFVQFFLEPDQRARVSMNSVDAYLNKKIPFGEGQLLVLTNEELVRARESQKITTLMIDRLIEYPDGSPGFVAVTFEYVENIDDILRVEREARKALVEESTSLNGIDLLVRHSLHDMGNLEAIFDNDHFTLLRGLEANPFILELNFSSPLDIYGFQADFANMDFTITAMLESSMGDYAEYSETFRGIPGDPHIEMLFENPPASVDRVRIEIFSHTHGESAHIHIRELELLWR